MFKSIPRLAFIAIRNGLIAGGLDFVFILTLFYIGKHPFLFPVYFDFRLILFSVFMVMGLKELRDYHQQGLLSFGEGMVSNLLFTTVFALFIAALILLFCAIEPGFVSNYIEIATAQLKTLEPAIVERLGKAVFDKSLNTLPGTTARDLAIDYMIKSFIISFFISIIISVILRRQPKTN